MVPHPPLALSFSLFEIHSLSLCVVYEVDGGSLEPEVKNHKVQVKGLNKYLWEVIQ